MDTEGVLGAVGKVVDPGMPTCAGSDPDLRTLADPYRPANWLNPSNHDTNRCLTFDTITLKICPNFTQSLQHLSARTHIAVRKPSREDVLRTEGYIFFPSTMEFRPQPGTGRRLTIAFNLLNCHKVLGA